MSDVSPDDEGRASLQNFVFLKHHISVRQWTKSNWRSVVIMLQNVTKAL
jgi:hypothetical protein